MAIRFGGRYSPDGQPGTGPAAGTGLARPAPGQARHRYESRTKWVTAMAAPLLVGAFFQGDPVAMASSLLGFGIIAAGMWMTREGLQAEAAYDARRIARRPAIPRKLFGGVLTGVGIAVGASEPGAFAGAAVLGVTGAVLHWLAFGPDPMRDKGMEGIDGFQQDRAARMVEEAETHLRGMTDAIQRTRDRKLQARVATFAATARALFERVEQNPGALTAARRYLGVYLIGARDATVKFADLYARSPDPGALRDYEALLADLETSFQAISQRLHDGVRTDMDIEIEVLRDRLAREGVRPPPGAALEDHSAEPTAAELLRSADHERTR
ncbi:5-bromo-4-chloroindolyl phosphate hydrolysis family protein [Paracoccus alkenifer]|uniref:5-bromo-4-chloroindolyl phosphate hydrolysis protein n=1 Tax=Paracoccus alkenifer TaxID=65735 RepID=A0A1H6MIX5_9RHOB|nr:5-bromo-4-chloroindolyl phosphate hydrolysis family protein [Paracoccus alkenifer]SEH97536.1 5-bromo-4-chloroindolyl phosphate hydrolysis protein [Paracoccus alkenifer]